MVIPNQKKVLQNALIMSTDLRQQLELLCVQLEKALQKEQERRGTCLARELVALISQATLVQTMALEIVHRMTERNGKPKTCPAGCQGNCPWTSEAQRIDRWDKQPDFAAEASRLALYDYQRGIELGLNLADFFEQKLQQCIDEQALDPPTQVSFCISSWLRKLARLLTLIGDKVCCGNHTLDETCVDSRQ